MSELFVRSYTHIIFSTKNREPYINEKNENNLYSYVAGILKQFDFIPIKVGGHKDHIHILCLPDKNRTIPDLVREIKARSSRWVKKTGCLYFHGKEDMEHFPLVRKVLRRSYSILTINTTIIKNGHLKMNSVRF